MGRHRLYLERREEVMGTVIRPELSKSNKYWISKNRYYELKYFCLQYPEWKKSYLGLDEDTLFSNIAVGQNTSDISVPTEKLAMVRMKYKEKMMLVERMAKESDPDLGDYIFKAVTEGLSFTHMKTLLNIPCSRDTYYDRYRKFFWLLNKVK